VNRTYVGTLVVLLGASVVPSVGAVETFDQRRQMLLEAVEADYREQADKPSGRAAFFRAEALFELGKVEEGRRLAHRGLDQLVPGNRENRWIHGGNSGFTAWPGLDCYVRYESLLDEALKDRYRKIYTGAVFYKRLTTSNHKIMAAVTRYLATQIWGADAFQPDPFFQGHEDDGAYFQKGDPTGEKYVRDTIAETAARGPGEYASRPYGAENILPILTIAECARDDALRRQAALAYESALLQLAPAYLRGHLATFSPRVYFGGVAPENLPTQWALRAATAKYRLPEMLEAVGTARAEPYVYRALLNRWALYHFVNRDYVLFSRSPKAMPNGFQGQSYPCGVMWEEPDVAKGSHLWITNPAADDPAQMGIHTHGVTKYEQEVQHRDALLFVFNIPADFRAPYVLGYVPGGYRAALTTPDRLLLHYGSVLIAVSSAAPLAWNPESGVRNPAGKPHEGDSEFRIPVPQTAVALETALPSEFPAANPAAQLSAFRDRLLAQTKIEFQSGVKPRGRYTDRAGNVLECEFDGEDRINGAAIDYTHWPTLDSPWTKLPQGDSILTATVGQHVRTYDLVHGNVTESTSEAGPREP
jgi:hypothetical protein